MQQQISSVPVQSSVASVPSIKLWTVGFISLVTIFMGFPAGIVLASINWIRMKMTDKAVAHLIAGAVGTGILLLGLILLPGSTGRPLVIIVSLIVLLYLRWQMQKDIKIFQATHTFGTAKWPGGCLIGLGVMVLYFLFAFFLAFVFIFLNVPIPD